MNLNEYFVTYDITTQRVTTMKDDKGNHFNFDAYLLCPEHQFTKSKLLVEDSTSIPNIPIKESIVTLFEGGTIDATSLEVCWFKGTKLQGSILKNCKIRPCELVTENEISSGCELDVFSEKIIIDRSTQVDPITGYLNIL